ncbi:MAG: hypothetical protein EZS28_002862 [Streblomastix strix]|uniref:Uncharacterized protein n=1 Tax=Streblomastix strix TaxID=222440 RepID=A0A5J4X338_9EUKA|nr:MAG: hypothetical protein EZS28_002862 [Streblomastix strix]
MVLKPDHIPRNIQTFYPKPLDSMMYILMEGRIIDQQPNQIFQIIQETSKGEYDIILCIQPPVAVNPLNGKLTPAIVIGYGIRQLNLPASAPNAEIGISKKIPHSLFLQTIDFNCETFSELFVHRSFNEFAAPSVKFNFKANLFPEIVIYQFIQQDYTIEQVAVPLAPRGSLVYLCPSLVIWVLGQSKNSYLLNVKLCG